MVWHQLLVGHNVSFTALAQSLTQSHGCQDHFPQHYNGDLVQGDIVCKRTPCPSNIVRYFSNLQCL